MTQTRSVFSATTPRSWLISTSAMPLSRRISLQQLQDLRLDGGVERRGRLVGDQEVAAGRPAPWRSSPAGSCRPTARADNRAAGALHRRCRPGRAAVAASASGRCPAEPAMELQRLAELPADAMDRIEAARRVLEDHGDARAAHGFERADRRADQIAAFEQDFAADAGARRRAARGRQARSRSCPSPIRPPARPPRRAAIARSMPCSARTTRLPGVEIDGQVAYVDKRFAHVRSDRLPRPCGSCRRGNPSGRRVLPSSRCPCAWR